MEHSETMHVESVFQLSSKEYPERKRTTIVITDKGDTVYVAVKAIARVYERNEEGNITVRQEQWGDISTLRKDSPIGCLFDSLKDLFDKVPEIIDKTTNNGDKA